MAICSVWVALRARKASGAADRQWIGESEKSEKGSETRTGLSQEVKQSAKCHDGRLVNPTSSVVRKTGGVGYTISKLLIMLLMA